MSATKSSTIRPLYDLVELDVTQLVNYPNMMQDIYDRKIYGIIVHNVFSPQEASTIVERLKLINLSLRWRKFFNASIYGQPLLVSQDLNQYCEEAAQFMPEFRELFSGLMGYENRITKILSAISGGLSVEVPTAPNGEPYSPVSIRVLEKNQFIGAHFDNYFLHHLPAYQHLSKILELEDHFGCFTMLSVPDAGGEIILYDLDWSDTENGMMKDGQPIESVIDKYDQMSIQLGVGDMIFHRGGRIYHRISPVEGARERITIGSFVSFSSDRKKVYYWS